MTTRWQHELALLDRMAQVAVPRDVDARHGVDPLLLRKNRLQTLSVVDGRERRSEETVVTMSDDEMEAQMEYWKSKAEAAEAERDRLREAATKVADAYTAEAEDHNDGEFALWQKDDLVNAIVALRAALREDA